MNDVVRIWSHVCFLRYQMFEDIIQQWQDNSLNLADYGLDFIPAPLSAPLHLIEPTQRCA